MDWDAYVRWYVIGMAIFAVIFIAGLASIIQYFIGKWWISITAAIICLIMWFLYITRT
jgi:hypothetical protein